MTGCERCPYLGMLDATDELLDAVQDIHNAPDASRGAVELYRRAMHAVQSRVPCDGPASSRDGMIECPLTALTRDALTMASAPVSMQGWAFEPGQVLGEERRTPGQFL
jgi:hypothetical protein